jgi:hypothetical protein
VARKDGGDLPQILRRAVMAGDHDGGMEAAGSDRAQLIEHHLEEHPGRHAGQPGIAVTDDPLAPRRLEGDLVDVPEGGGGDDAVMLLGRSASQRLGLQGIQA